jgi:hypothetical protein
MTAELTTPVTAAADITPLVREAMDMEWPAFVARHPRLAGVVDRAAVIAALSAQLAADPEYHRSIAESESAGPCPTVAAQTTRAFVRDWLSGMFF